MPDDDNGEAGPQNAPCHDGDGAEGRAEVHAQRPAGSTVFVEPPVRDGRCRSPVGPPGDSGKPLPVCNADTKRP